MKGRESVYAWPRLVTSRGSLRTVKLSAMNSLTSCFVRRVTPDALSAKSASKRISSLISFSLTRLRMSLSNFLNDAWNFLEVRITDGRADAGNSKRNQSLSTSRFAYIGGTFHMNTIDRYIEIVLYSLCIIKSRRFIGNLSSAETFS